MAGGAELGRLAMGASGLLLFEGADLITADFPTGDFGAELVLVEGGTGATAFGPVRGFEGAVPVCAVESFELAELLVGNLFELAP